jgi:hypothetical protein
MKKIITLLVVLSVGFVNAQAFKGKGDFKVQVGAHLPEKATGIHLTADYGVGENMSIGVATSYLMGFADGLKASDVKFGDKIDIRARFNANIGNVINIDDKLDIYPGLSLGIHDFGGHLGARYFFSDGFGVYTELGTQFAQYNSDDKRFFAANLGVSFNL